MIDGFLVVADSPGAEQKWELDRKELYRRSFKEKDPASGADLAGIDFIWPGEGHLDPVNGTLTEGVEYRGNFWVRPRLEKGKYVRYFNYRNARFYHWVGIEVPAEDKDKAHKMFRWELVSPKSPPLGWHPAEETFEYTNDKGQKRYAFIYIMPTGPLPKGVTKVELHLKHPESGAYLARERHSVTIGSK